MRSRLKRRISVLIAYTCLSYQINHDRNHLFCPFVLFNPFKLVLSVRLRLNGAEKMGQGSIFLLSIPLNQSYASLYTELQSMKNDASLSRPISFLILLSLSIPLSQSYCFIIYRTSKYEKPGLFSTGQRYEWSRSLLPEIGRSRYACVWSTSDGKWPR